MNKETFRVNFIRLTKCPITVGDLKKLLACLDDDAYIGVLGMGSKSQSQYLKTIGEYEYNEDGKIEKEIKLIGHYVNDIEIKETEEKGRTGNY